MKPLLLFQIGGLKSIASRCRYLRHLNLGSIHQHSCGPNNDLLEILSSIKYLISVSLSGCSTIPFKAKQDQEMPSECNTDGEEKTEESLSNDDEQSSRINDDHCHNGFEKPNSCLKTFINSCTFLHQIEIINVGFHSVLRKGWMISRPPPERYVATFSITVRTDSRQA